MMHMPGKDQKETYFVMLKYLIILKQRQHLSPHNGIFKINNTIKAF